MNCLIVDDNQIARTTMRQLASHVKSLVVSGEFSGSAEAYEVIKKGNINLILLDIEMPGMNGMELAANLKDPRPLIIFTTSKKEYAAEAFDLNVVDYIVKPVTLARFLQAVAKAEEIFESKHEEVSTQDNEFIFIRDGNIVRRLDLEDILYAEAMGDYVKLHTTSRFHAVHTTLKQVEERLSSSRFMRVHRSYIVALSRIDGIQDSALIVGGKPIPVADSYRAAVNKKMNIL